MKTIEQLNAEKAAIDIEIKAIKELQRAENVEKVKHLMSALNVTLRDIASPRKKQQGASSSKQYMHPETGAYWYGRGPRPKWLRDEVLSASNKTLKDYEVVA